MEMEKVRESVCKAERFVYCDNGTMIRKRWDQRLGEKGGKE